MATFRGRSGNAHARGRHALHRRGTVVSPPLSEPLSEGFRLPRPRGLSPAFAEVIRLSNGWWLLLNADSQSLLPLESRPQVCLPLMRLALDVAVRVHVWRRRHG